MNNNHSLHLRAGQIAIKPVPFTIESRTSLEALERSIVYSGENPSMEGIFFDGITQSHVTTNGFYLVSLFSKETINGSYTINPLDGEVLATPFPEYHGIIPHNDILMEAELAQILYNLKGILKHNKTTTEKVRAEISCESINLHVSAEALSVALTALAESGTRSITFEFPDDARTKPLVARDTDFPNRFALVMPLKYEDNNYLFATVAQGKQILLPTVERMALAVKELEIANRIPLDIEFHRKALERFPNNPYHTRQLKKATQEWEKHIAEKAMKVASLEMETAIVNEVPESTPVLA